MASATVRTILARRDEYPRLNSILSGNVDQAVAELSGPDRKVWFSDEGREHISILLRAYYEVEDVSTIYARAITFFALAIGISLFIIPSLEVFIMVLKRVLR
jgi:hypothetical protein